MPTCFNADQVEEELNRVSVWFNSGGSYYDYAGDKLTVSRELLMSAVDCPVQVKRMKGDVDPRTEHDYDSKQTAVLLSVQSQNLLHNSVKDEGEIGGAKLPGGTTDILQLTVEELKAMMTAHTENLTGDNGNH